MGCSLIIDTNYKEKPYAFETDEVANQMLTTNTSI